MKPKRNGRSRGSLNSLKLSDKERATLRVQNEYAASAEQGVCSFPHKHAYLTRKEAKAVLAKVKHKSPTRLHVYKCPCGRFHLGTAAMKPGPAEELA